MVETMEGADQDIREHLQRNCIDRIVKCKFKDGFKHFFVFSRPEGADRYRKATGCGGYILGRYLFPYGMPATPALLLAIGEEGELH